MTIYNREDARTVLPQLEKRLQDYIVEQGSKGIWTYRKWNSGIAECWGVYSYSTSVSSVWASPIYVSTMADAQPYPFKFKEIPMEWASVESSENACWLYKESSGHNTTTHTASYRPLKVNSFSSSTQTFEIRYYVKGTWK